MITYSKIGHFGRLGNQLFQFASTLGIGRQLGYEVVFPLENMTQAVVEHFKDGKVLDITFDVPKAFDIPQRLLAPRASITTTTMQMERFFHYDASMLTIPDGVDLGGYYQSEKYFLPIEDELRSILTFKPHITQCAKDLFPNVDGTTVGIHIRRGDYVQLSAFHPPCEPEYYLEAAQHFTDSNPYFIIFSDDIDYCKSLFAESENILYINNNDPYVDLCLMSMCDHNIIANSSFSWWGAWLNDNPHKKVIAPKKWFGHAYQHNTNDLYCQDWTIL
jgi:hypothetical protein